MKTLYLTDLDGTLLTSAGAVSETTARTVNALANRGLLLSVSTARTFLSASKLVETLDLRAPAVLNNGVFLYDLQKKRVLSYHAIAHGALQAAIRIFTAHDKAPQLFLYGDDGLLSIHFTEHRLQVQKDFYEARKASLQGRFRRVEKLQVPPGQHPTYLSTVDTYESLLPITKTLENIPELRFSFYADSYSPYWFLEVYSGKAGKGTGALEAKRLCGADRLVVFGDNLNDLPMFAVADAKYAVANAVGAVKEAADGVIDSCDDDGVAKFLEKRFS